MEATNERVDGLVEDMGSMKDDVGDIKTALMDLAKSDKKRGADISSALADKSGKSKKKKKVTIAASVQKGSDSDESEDDEPVHDVKTLKGSSKWLTNYFATRRS